MPAVNLPDLRDLIDDLVRNPAHQVTPAQRERAIELALVRYSADRPREVVEDVVTADGATVPLPAGWVAGESLLRIVECPVVTPPVPLEADAWAMWRTPTGEVIGLLQAATPGATARLHYTAPHVVDATSSTIPSPHREAVACYAASLLAEQIATAHASAQDSTIAADRVDQAHPAREWAARAKAYRNRYFATLGIEISAQGVEQPRIDAAGVVVDLNLPTSHGRGRMYRRR